MVGKTRSLLITFLNLPSLFCLGGVLWFLPAEVVKDPTAAYLFSSLASELWTKGSITKGLTQMDDLGEKSSTICSILWTPSGQGSHSLELWVSQHQTPGWLARWWTRQVLVPWCDPVWSLGSPCSLWVTHRGDIPGAEAPRCRTLFPTMFKLWERCWQEQMLGSDGRQGNTWDLPGSIISWQKAREGMEERLEPRHLSAQVPTLNQVGPLSVFFSTKPTN